ncbi:hypothetical protein ACFQ14_12795 [Pseudahrensia aquimaris]|uniref:Ca2+-binding protein, RTX toxin-related n=1 Tax=Pseudahrensia aquimaris TaxID=744461 RepID=A0ABW3FI30_9HYPH
MATITTYSGSLLPITNSVNDWLVDRDVVLVATATLYVWTTPDGHRVSLTGNFTYPNGVTEPPEGTVDEMNWDTGGDGVDDVIIDYLAFGGSAIDVGEFVEGVGGNPSQLAGRFWTHALTNVNSGTLNGFGAAADFDINSSTFGFQGFGLDGTSGLSAASESDDFTITATGLIIGDKVQGGSSFVYAADDLTFDRAAAGLTVIVGDLGETTSLAGTITGAADRITDLSQQAGETYLVGDVWEHDWSNSLVGGSDTINSVSFGATMVGDVWRINNSTTNTVTVTGGADLIFGSARADTIIGDVYEFSNGTSADVLIAGADTIDGGNGDDTIFGDYQFNSTGALVVQGDDVIDGGLGDDTIWGQTGDDTINGEEDDDWIEGGAGSDDLTGGTHGSLGDTLAYTFSSSAVEIDLGVGTALGGDAIGDTFTGFENLVGSDHDDVLTGDTNLNVIEGGSGSDTLSRGGDGADILRGGEGDDYFFINDGAAGLGTTLEGGEGTDSILLAGSGFAFKPNEYVLDSVEQIVFATTTNLLTRVDFTSAQLEDEPAIASLHLVNQTGGPAQVRVDDGVRASVDLSGLTFETWVGDSDDILVLGDADDETLIGASVASDLRGREGNDMLLGGAGDDQLWGEEGNDNLEGGAGADYLNGGTNDFDDIGDTLSYASSDAAVNVNLQDNTASGGHAEGDTIVLFENLIGSAFADTLFGRTGNSIIEGGDGNDRIFGDRGDDILRGERGNDTFLLNYDARNYVLVDGGANYDTIILRDFAPITLENKDIRSIESLIFEMTESVFDAYLVTDAATWKTAAPSGLDVFVREGFTGGIDMVMDGETELDLSSWTFTNWSGHIEINGDNDAETITGTAVAATINGNGGEDSLSGGDGDDDIDGGSDADIMSGGAGSDEYWVENVGDTTVELLDEGYDRVYVSGLSDWTLADNVERLTFLDTGNHTATGNELGNRIDGNAGNDTFILDAGGNDIFSGGQGQDTFDARAGSMGIDIDLVSGTHGGDAAGDLFASMEVFWGSNNAAVSDTMVTGAARAKFYGFAGDDDLTGGATVDYLDGGLGNDTLNGMGARDGLRGFVGDDILTGGADRDYFQYVFAEFDHDTITDYEDGLDYLRVFSDVATTVTDFTITGNGTSSVMLTLNDGTGENTITINGAGGSNVTIDAADFLFY